MVHNERQTHTAEEFGLDVLGNETDMFRWFLLCYLFGKPIQSKVAIATWKRFVDDMLDTPWAIVEESNYYIVTTLHDGGYTRYQHVTADGLKKCMERLIREYEGSILLILESSTDAEEFSKRLQKLHGVGPKVVEIFSRETDEYFARRVE